MHYLKDDIVEHENLTFRKAQIHELNDIHLILSKSFRPYKKDYTKSAFDATVLNPTEIQNRIADQKHDIFVVIQNKHIIGTVSLLKKGQDQLFIRSMAVHPDYQKRGFGLFILKKISELAKRKNIKTIFLDTYKPLKRAVKFYEKFGFKYTGVTQDLYGVEICEMIIRL